jgi:hypothetical protein
MDRSLICPTCGHKHWVSDKHPKKNVKCLACNETLRSSPKSAESRSGSRSGAEPDQSLGQLPHSPLSGDGTVQGAITGVLTGVLGAVLVGVLSEKDIGDIIAKVMLGFAIGCGMGTLIGALLGRGARRIYPHFQVKPGLALFLGGALVGSLVMLLVEDRQWIALGAGIGAVASNVWQILCNRLELGLNESNHVVFQDDRLYDEARAITQKHYL